jgi:hypothetical protein
MGRDMAQVAAQAEAEARRQLLAASADPAGARHLARILRSLAVAAGAGAREGRARLAMELLAVDARDGEPPAERPAPQPAAAASATASVPVPPRPPRPARAHEAAEPAPARPAPAVDPQPTVSPAAPPAASPAASAGADPIPAGELAGVADRWAEVVERASPAIKPLLRECRPVALEGVRLTLAFPEERRFMREKASTRAAAIEALLAEVLTGSWAIECVTSNVELTPLSVVQAVAGDPTDPDGQALLEGVLRITGGELVDVPEVR